MAQAAGEVDVRGDEAAEMVIYADGEVSYEWVDGSDADDEDFFGDGSDEEDLCPCCRGASGHDEGEGGLEGATQSADGSTAGAGTETTVETAAMGMPKEMAAEAPQPPPEPASVDSGTTGQAGPACDSAEPGADPASVDSNDAEAAFETGPGGVLIAPRYYEWKALFPFLSKLLDNYDVLVEELLQLTSGRWCPWPEYKLYQSTDQNGDWKVIPMLHTFPAWDPSRMQVIESNCSACPRTMALLREIPGLRTVLFSRLGPRTRLSSHQGWADLSNYVLRCHLPLVVPAAPQSCGMWVEGDVRFHEPRNFLVFDDSKFHKAFNASEEERIILIFDIERPATVPRGLATGGHTEQLDHFIAEYQRSLGLPVGEAP